MITKKEALTAATTFKKARDEFHNVSLRYIVEQTMGGNSDAIGIVFHAAGLLWNKGGQLQLTKDGTAAWNWLKTTIDKGGCGLGALLRWDKEKRRFFYRDGWSKKADTMDMDAIEHNFRAWRYDQWGKNSKPADQEFNLEARVIRLVADAKKKGKLTPSEIEAQVQNAVKAALFKVA
jgi:hypothetical protein